jgi:hypothetical protein
MRNKLILLFILLIILGLSFYYCYYTTKQIESFENNVTTKPCVVWFTQQKQECDQGFFYKDPKTLDYISKVNILGDLDKEIQDHETKLTDIKKQVSNYDGLSLSEIQEQLVIDLNKKIREEQSKQYPDVKVIEQYKKDIDNYQSIAEKHFKDAAGIKNEVVELENKIKTLKHQREANKFKPTFNMLENIKNIKEKNPNFKCKLEYTGWDEIASENDPTKNDIEKNVTGLAKDLGHPSQWAYCHKEHKTEAEKLETDRYIQQNKFAYIKPYDSKIGPMISSIAFQEFNEMDEFICDDRLVAPKYPTIPNGLLQIKLDNKEHITEMNVVKYANDSRYIVEGLTRRLVDLDPTILMNIFYDLIIEIDKSRVQVYVYPNDSITYKVHFLYFDNTCKRFYGDTSIPYGPTKKGDLFAKSHPMILFEKEMSSSLTETPIREYLNPKVISVQVLQTKLTEWISEVQKESDRLSELDKNIEKNMYLQHIYKALASDQPDQVKSLKIDTTTDKPVYGVQIEQNLTKEVYLQKANEYQSSVEKDKLEKEAVSSKIAENRKKIEEVNLFMNLLKPSIEKTIKEKIVENLKNYLNVPVTDFIKSYDPTYISNNNTIYMAIESINKNTKTTVTLHGSPPKSMVQETIKEISRIPSYTIPKKNIRLEDDIIISNFSEDTYF